MGMSAAFFGSRFLEGTPLGFLAPYFDSMIAVLVMLVIGVVVAYKKKPVSPNVLQLQDIESSNHMPMSIIQNDFDDLEGKLPF